jgi:carboxylesterase type B
MLAEHLADAFREGLFRVKLGPGREGRCEGLPHWPAYDTKTPATMIFNTATKVVNDPSFKLRRILERT